MIWQQYQDLLERRWKLATLMVIAEHSGLGLKINVGVISWFSIAGLGCCKGGAAWSRLGFPLRFLAWWKVVQEDEPVVTAKVKTNRVGGGVDGVLTATSRLRCRGKGPAACGFPNYKDNFLGGFASYIREEPLYMLKLLLLS
ncbi:uncharacterized protein HKW66_Vig0180330 [Vigna angularis]|uniref:Uncharacterized protein n=1 Tax=Phaseolus angularis TaxID=3914 RepID=A0A8T0K5W3_PHAAN|nr:uncharacterized protein HKW66_Vig0180330 [Vigna angularis]